ncbi:VapE domain-containing protein [Serratia marcescens]|uniref:VapE domain-containing protein n=1 Tax=Serratia marcescens TaxID=615 RepID=UPI00066C369E|nr:VapE domain-containing protein [Serratia marcescens]
MPKQQIWGAAPDDWFHFSFVLGLTPDLLPVVSRPDAPISPTSKLKTTGKTPSHYNGQGMVAGLKDWTARTSTDDDVGRWAKQPDYGILLQTRTVRALDVDVSDPVVADAILSAVTTMIGPLPKRMRANSPKFLLAFQLEGQMSKRILRTEAGNIEFLATGQQFVALGTHPSGARYEWDGGLPDEIPVLGAEDFEAVWCMLETVFGVGETVVEKEGRLRDRSARDAGATDETADYLDANDWTLDWGAGGERYIRCPFEDGHSTESADNTATAYFPAGTGGFEQGHFRCLHASCAHRNDGDFLNAIGIRDNDFDVIPAEGGEEYLPLPAFSRDKNGQIEGTITNVLLALRRPDLCGVQIRLDEFRNEVILTTPRGEHLLLRDEYYTKIHETLERNLQFKKFQETEIKRSVRLIAYENRYDSLKDWLSQLPAWDGVPRIDTFFCRHWGIDSSAYSKAVGRYWWTLLAGRALEPGIKGDMAVVLVSQQGKNKSEGIRAMAPTPEHYMELDFEKPAAERVREMRGHNVIELGEMRGMNKAGIGAVRVTISTRADRNRGLYREHYDTLPRRCGFIATVNTDTPLTDTEGNRRWLPMTIPDDIDGKHIAAQIATEREQLWAEAVLVFKAEGIAWERAETLAKTVLGDYEVKDDVWVSCIAEWLEAESTELNDNSLVKNCDRVPLTSKDLLVEAIGFKAPQVKRGDEMKVAKIMKDLGYKTRQLQTLPGKPRHWEKRG